MRYVVSALAFALVCASHAFAAPLPEGADLTLGGLGEGNGKFQILRDFNFDARGRLYVLDGAEYQNESKAIVGNRVIQVFEPDGKFVRQFPIAPPARQSAEGNPRANQSSVPGIYDDPQRLAVDRAGNVYVTQPASGVLQIYSPKDQLITETPIPWAMTVAPWRGKMAVLGSQEAALPQKGWTPMGGDQVYVVDAAGKIVQEIKLGQRLTHVLDMATDAKGNFYFQADKNQIYQFGPDGKLLKAIGAGTSARRIDGSELIHTTAVDREGSIYGMTVGNPGFLTKFAPNMTMLWQRGGQFAWADSWSYPGGRTIVRVDAENRLWVATSARSTRKDKFPTPAILRLRSDYFAQAKAVDVRAMGLTAKIETPLVDSIAYDLSPITATLVIDAAKRNVQHVRANWQAFDTFKKSIGKGTFDLSLQDGIEARQDFTFTPTAYGWCTVELSLTELDGAPDKPLRSIGKHFGVTKVYSDLPALEAGKSNGTWEDPWRQAFVGHPMLRLHPAKGMDKFDKDLTACEQAGVFAFGQFTDKKDCTVENVEAFVKRFKGRVKVWEVMNEPNFSMGPDDYAALVKKLYPVIKANDPEAKVMGPDVCGIDLWYYRKFYQAGGKDFVDILSIHDYEGHETIDPVHWRWKFGELRKLMAEFGDADKPLWQTERTIGGVRGGLFQGASQVVRATLQQDLDTVLGVVENRNWLYYLNEGGYSAVPTFLWSKAGPHPAAIALRTRHAMLASRSYANEIDFGPSGKKFLLGLRYAGSAGDVLVLRNLGLDQAVTLPVRIGEGAAPVVVDAFGNEHPLPVTGGVANVSLSQMPIYLRLAPGQQATFDPIDFGENLAGTAKFAFSGPSDNIAHINNGVWDTYQHGNPAGAPNGKMLFKGEMPKDKKPATLDITFDAPKTIGTVLIASMRADNPFGPILDYDLQYRQGTRWVTLKQVRTSMPESSWATTPDCMVNTWYQDTNLCLDQFKPVTTTALRLVIHRTTFGYAPDEVANEALRRKDSGDGIPANVWIREIEIYGGN